MADNDRVNWPVQESNEPTIRFSIDPELLKTALQKGSGDLVDTYVGPPLLPPETSEPAPLPTKRGANKWVKLACVCAALCAIACAALLLFPRGADAAKTADTFLRALETGDFALLYTVAEGDGIALTQENTAPLFALYQADDAFRQELRGALTAPSASDGAEQGLFRLMAREEALGRTYTVIIAPGKAVIESNLPEAHITVNGDPAATGLLPGSYAVAGVYTASYGDEFWAETTVQVRAPQNHCALWFDYTSMAVYNSASEPVQVRVGGSEYATLAPAQELIIAPIAPETEIVVVNPQEQTLTATAAEGNLYVYFDRCQVEINNDYDDPMLLTRNNLPDETIPPRGRLTLTDVPAGETLTLTLDAAFGLLPYVQQVQYDFDYVYPYFQLNDGQLEALRTVATGHVLAAYEAYAQGAPLVAALPQSALTRELAALLAQPDPPILLADTVTLAEYRDLRVYADGGMDLWVAMTVTEPPPAQEEPPLVVAEGEPTQLELPAVTVVTRMWKFDMALRDGQWRIQPDAPLLAEGAG